MQSMGSTPVAVPATARCLSVSSPLSVSTHDGDICSACLCCYEARTGGARQCGVRYSAIFGLYTQCHAEWCRPNSGSVSPHLPVPLQLVDLVGPIFKRPYLSEYYELEAQIEI